MKKLHDTGSSVKCQKDDVGKLSNLITLALTNFMSDKVIVLLECTPIFLVACVINLFRPQLILCPSK